MKQIIQLLLFYTTPEVAKEYGKNYVAIMGKFNFLDL